MTKFELEQIHEAILELLSSNEAFQDAVLQEFNMRFPGQDVLDEENAEKACICQLLVMDRVLKGVVK